jgi:hypothetical protein
MPAIPKSVLRKLYVQGSLRTEDGDFILELKNTIAPATITALTGLDVDGQAMDPALVTTTSPSGKPRPASGISTQTPLPFPIGATITLHVTACTLEPGPHELVVHAIVEEVGPIAIPVSDLV